MRATGGQISGGKATGGSGANAGGTTSSGGTSTMAVATGGARSGGGNGGAAGTAVSSGGAGGTASRDGGTRMDAAIDALPNKTGFGDFTGVCAYKESDFPALQAIGIKNARMDYPSAATIEKARTYGIEVLPLANYGIPELSAQPGQNDDMYPPTAANMAEWSKRKLDAWRSMQRPPRVIEVWNEPWNAGFWKPQPDAAAYLSLVKAFAKEAWSVWPQVTLLVSADTVYPDEKFRDALLAADTTGFLNDARILPTTHDYVEGRSPAQTTSDPCSYDLNRHECAYAAFKAHGHPNPLVWVTEFGWESDTPGGTNSVTPVTESVQAEYTVDALRIFRSSGHVVKAFAFMYNSNDPWNYDWLRPDNSQKPVCQSVRALVANGN